MHVAIALGTVWTSECNQYDTQTLPTLEKVCTAGKFSCDISGAINDYYDQKNKVR